MLSWLLYFPQCSICDFHPSFFPLSFFFSWVIFSRVCSVSLCIMNNITVYILLCISVGLWRFFLILMQFCSSASLLIVFFFLITNNYWIYQIFPMSIDMPIWFSSIKGTTLPWAILIIFMMYIVLNIFLPLIC